MGVIQYNTRSKNIGPFTEELNSLITNCNLDYDATKNLILINEHNGDEIEKVIEADKDYIPFAKYIFNYLVKSYQTQMDKDKLIAIIREIDRDNSTNIWRYKKSREKIFKAVDFIVEPKHNFYERLKVGDKTLPDQINAYVGSGMPSLSSKICKYLAEYIYGNDAYYINDSYVRALALFYYEYYFGCPHPKYKRIYDINNLSYEELFDLLEEIRFKTCSNLTRNKFDHIIWYSYKSYVIH